VHFFFDYTTRDKSLRDYQGHEFPNSEAACDFAEAIAQTFKNSLNSTWSDWFIEVRDAEGTKYFSLSAMTGRQVTTSSNAALVQPVKNQISLLIIEDALIHSAVIGQIASKVGLATTKAHSYEDACEVLDARQFDCITLDLGLGEHAGIDMLRYLSMVRCKAQIIVISQSNKEVCDDVVELGRALDLNVCESVPKPIDLNVLRETLVRVQAQSLPQKATRVRPDSHIRTT
jgi:two-component system, chemotaxis family, chemotaxis protein CheY